MAITLNCPKCSKPFRVRDDVIGMRVKCPNCSAILQVPAALSPASLLISDVPPEPMDMESPPSLLDAPGHGGRPLIPGHRPNIMNQGHAHPPEEDVRSTFNSHSFEPPRPQNVPQMNNLPMPGARPTIPGPSPTPPMNSHASTNYIGDTSAAASHAWGRVRSGLGYVRFGLILLLLPGLAEIARLYLMENKPEMFEPAKPGFLKFGSFNFWQEVRLLYVAAPVALGFLLILLGRTICLSAPGTSRTGRLAFASVLCTLLSMGGLALCAYAFLMPQLGKTEAMPEIQWLGAGLALVFGVMAEVWFSLFQGQVGFVLGYPAIQRQIGIATMLVALTGFGILAADAFHPFLNVDAKVREMEIYQDVIADLDEKDMADIAKEEPKKDDVVVPTTTKEKAKILKDKALVKAKEIKEKGKEFVTNRRNLPSLALYLFVGVFILAMHSIAGSTRSIIRGWTGMHPAM